ncbi:MAG TPA: pseudouridine synthase [Rubricoccaceae bacterium]|jgi:23S rRNA pseudouridine1911/1915/1917 synthase
MQYTNSHPTSGEPDKIETLVALDVPAGQAPVRIDVYLTDKLANATRAKVQRALRDGCVDVNDETVTKVSTPVQPGDRILCRLMKPPPIEILPEDIPLNIVYEDDVLVVLDKPAAMVVHPAFGHRTGTLVNALLHHVGAGPLRASDLAETPDDEADDDGDEETVAALGLSTATAGPRFDGDPTVRPGLVHRLDRDTTGLMVVAKNDIAAAHLAAQFAARTTRRRYLALVWGEPDPAEGRIETYLGRSPRDRKKIAVVPEEQGKWAATNYETVERLGYFALVAFRLETGRTHQIRVHARALGHPVFGDRTYDGDRIHYGPGEGSRRQFIHNLLTALPRQALHAHTLGFEHPTTGEAMDFEAPIPPDMAYVLDRIRAVEGAA